MFALLFALACTPGTGDSGQPAGDSANSDSGAALGPPHVASLAVGNGWVCWGDADGLVACDGIAAPDGPWWGLAGEGAILCALDADGRNTCWGTALTVPGPQQQLAVGDYFVCGVGLPDGRLSCAGLVEDPPDGDGWSGLSAGGGTACAIDFASRVVCWGTDAGNLSSHSNAVDVGLDDQICSIAAGRAGGKVHCSLFGDASTTLDGDVYASVATGSGWCCALDQQGVPTCSAQAPISPAIGDQTYTVMDAGTSQLCGLEADGQHNCWPYIR